MLKLGLSKECGMDCFLLSIFNAKVAHLLARRAHNDIMRNVVSVCIGTVSDSNALCAGWPCCRVIPNMDGDAPE